MKFITSHREIFEMFDLNKDGIISFWEIHKVLNDLGKSLSEDEVVELLLGTENNGKGDIDLDKFLEKVFFEEETEALDEQTSLDDALKTEEKMLKETFRLFDHEKRNSIALSDFKFVLSTLDMDISEPMMDEILKEADVSGTGQVEYDSKCLITYSIYIFYLTAC